MALTPEQLAFEDAFFDKHVKAHTDLDVETALSHFADDALLIVEHGTFQGKEAIYGYLQGALGALEYVTVKRLSRSYDVAQSLTWWESETTLILKGDPEKKVLKTNVVYRAKKALGTGETKIENLTRFGNSPEVRQRGLYLQGLQAK